VLTGGAPSQRFDSIDQARGAIMILMALDHVRWFFTDISTYQPESLAETNLWLFLTRWATHFCAPGFFLLAGMGIFLYASGVESGKAVRTYLLSRGLVLIILELTIVGYSWIFDPGYSFGGVIWSLGCSFLLMALLVNIPRIVLLFGSASILLCHNFFLDNIAAPESGWPLFLWRSLYQPGSSPIPGIADSYYFLFPIIPWLAIMVFGFSVAHYYLRNSDERRRVFTILGLGTTAAFIVLRLIGAYGNPDTLWISPATSGHFSIQPELSKTVINFLNTEKYPPSLQFTLMTLGPIFLWLGLSRIDQDSTRASWPTSVLVLFGRVPLFFYLCHLYLIHLLALAITTFAGQPNDWIAFGADPSASRPSGYGFGLSVIHIVWLICTVVLYFLCRQYAQYKRHHNYTWLKYL
jgi:uncharacterized membrane protein